MMTNNTTAGIAAMASLVAIVGLSVPGIDKKKKESKAAPVADRMTDFEIKRKKLVQLDLSPRNFHMYSKAVPARM